MEHLWTPWRMAYIRGEKKPVEGCVFCNKINANDDEEQVIARSTHVFVTLNRYPYNNGHLMVVPYEHVASQESLSAEVLTDLMLTINRSLAVLRAAYNPQAFNMGANIGTAAGAGIAEHYHFHIVPRWSGDSNFMGVVGNTRVIPDTLENTYKELKAQWTQLFGEQNEQQS
jgi:ATP adenylyltransferase